MSTEKSAMSSATNWVTTVATIANIVLVNLGLPIPTETLVSIGVAVQGLLTLWARNRSGGGGRTYIIR